MRKGRKRVVCERWVGDWTHCNILTPSSSDYSSTSFSFCLAAQLGVLRAQALCWELVLTASNCYSNFNCDWLQLTRTVCGNGLYNCLTPTCFLWVSHLHRIQPVHGQDYILISSTRCTCFLIDGWVEGQCYIRNYKPDISIIIFTNPSARAGYDTRSIFQQSLTGLNSEFSFS